MLDAKYKWDFAAAPEMVIGIVLFSTPIGITRSGNWCDPHSFSQGQMIPVSQMQGEEMQEIWGIYGIWGNKRNKGKWRLKNGFQITKREEQILTSKKIGCVN